MASTINATTASGGGVITTADASGVLQLQTGGTTAVTVDASQNVGIGTASPSANFEIYGLSSPYQITGNGTQKSFLGVDSNGGFSGTLSNHSFFLRTNNTNRLVIDTSGRVTTPYQPAFFATPTAGFTTTAPGSYFSFNSLNGTFCSSNRSSGYNTSTLVYTAPVAGLYQFYVSFYMNGTTISAQWFKNGVGMTWGDAALMIFQSGTTTQIVNGTVIVELAVGDYIGVQPRAGSATVGYYGGHSCFFGYLIG